MNIDGSNVPSYTQSTVGSRLTRASYFGNSNAMGHFGRYGNQQDCDAMGLGYTFDSKRGNCYFPCPDAYLINADDTRTCDPRPQLTKAEIYYEIMSQAVKDCAKLIPAYKDLVAEHNNDPTQVGFPEDSGCINPYGPPPPLPSDPVGVYDNNASNGDIEKPKDAPPDVSGGTTVQAPTIIVDDKDPSGMNKNLPRDRILITTEEIDQLPKVNDYGMMTDGTLALQLRAHPTFLDVNPTYLLEFQKAVPSFQWEITITPEEYALLPEELQCAISTNYAGIYSNPSQISELRLHAPSITLTRNAPSTFPVFPSPRTKAMLECEAYNITYDTYVSNYAKYHVDGAVDFFSDAMDYQGNMMTEEQFNERNELEAKYGHGGGRLGNAVWVGDCRTGYCKQPDKLPPQPDIPTPATDTGMSSYLLIGGLVLLLGGGAYYFMSSSKSGGGQPQMIIAS